MGENSKILGFHQGDFLFFNNFNHNKEIVVIIAAKNSMMNRKNQK